MHHEIGGTTVDGTYLVVAAIALPFHGARLASGERLSDFVMNALLGDARDRGRGDLITVVVARENARSLALCRRFGIDAELPSPDRAYVQLVGWRIWQFKLGPRASPRALQVAVLRRGCIPQERRRIVAFVQEEEEVVGMLRIHRLLTSGAIVLFITFAVGGALAGPYPPTAPVQASGASPFAGCTADNVAGQVGTNVPNSEVEPWIDVNPTNASNIVGIYQQDRWSNGGARGLVASVSTNGGASFTQVVIPKVSACSGNLAYARATDPWVSFAPNGDLYAMSLSLSADLRRSAMLVSKSTTGGSSWGDPTVLIDETSDFNLNDKNSLTADPTNSAFVYAVWDRIRHPGQRGSLEHPAFNALHAFSFRSDIMFSRTTNGGTSWEPARAIFMPKANLFTIGNQIAVLPNGHLVNVFTMFRGSGVQPTEKQSFIALIRSTDKGVTWSQPIIVDNLFIAGVSDPDTGQPHRTGDIIPDVAVDMTSGDLYIAWQDGRFTGRAAIALSRSTNGGLTWSSPIKVNQTPLLGTLNDQAFTPSVHVAADGTVGVSYYDFRNNGVGGGTNTDHFLAHCHSACDNAASWVPANETRVTTPSFDSRLAPFARGFFLGDYVGLDNVGNAFTPFFTQTTATDPANEYFAKVGP